MKNRYEIEESKRISKSNNIITLLIEELQREMNLTYEEAKNLARKLHPKHFRNYDFNHDSTQKES